MRFLVPQSTGRVVVGVIALSTIMVSAQSQVRSIDGSRNNITHPDYGRAGTPLLRNTTVDYGDGLSSPAGALRPSARAVSNAVVAQSGSILNDRRASDFVWQWGQFLDHDLDLTGGMSPAEAFDVPVPMGDPHFDPTSTGTQMIPLDRSLYIVDAAGVRQQVNEITAWLDGSVVYGSDATRADSLRTHVGGRLRTSAGDLLPFNSSGQPNAPSGDPSFFLAGDIRSNEQNGLTALHTLFVREHNYWAAVYDLVPFFGDEMVYQLARQIVAAELQSITYNEFLPAVLGSHGLGRYRGYDPSIDPSISNIFSAACYRVGHSMLSETLLRLDENLDEIPAGHLSLANAFFAPQSIIDYGIEPLLRGLASQEAQRVDMHIVDPVRNFLFGPPGAGGFDLASLNIQRGRDHGLPCYNQARIDMGLPPRASFGEVSSNPLVAAALQSVYASVDDIDAWVGGLAEDHVPGGLVGELVAVVLREQFERLRDGDRFWYQRQRGNFVRFIRAQQLSVIIRRNTTIGNELQRDVFRVPN